MTNPFLRFDAPSLEITPTLPSSEIFTSFTVRASTFIVSIITILAGSLISQKYASPSALCVPVTAKSFPVCLPMPAHTQRSDVLWLEMVPCPTTSSLLRTFLGTTFTFLDAENPLDWAVNVYIPGVSATNLPFWLIKPDAGRPILSVDWLLIKLSVWWIALPE